MSAAISTIDFILTDPDIAAGVVGMPSYLHCMTAFACMFLIKVAVKYGADLVEPDRVWDLTTSLVRHFRSLPAGRWHLANLMAPGLERMAATLRVGGAGAAQARAAVRPQDAAAAGGMVMQHGGVVDPMAMAPGADPTLMGAEGDLFFDYDMSFGLSPVFRFDAAALGMDPTAAHGTAGQMQEFAEVDYGMARPPT